MDATIKLEVHTPHEGIVKGFVRTLDVPVGRLVSDEPFDVLISQVREQLEVNGILKCNKENGNEKEIDNDEVLRPR